MDDEKSSDAPVQIRAEWQFAAANDGAFVCPSLGNDLPPLRYQSGSAAELFSSYLGPLEIWVEVGNHVLFEHDASYNMLNSNMEYAKQQVAYPNGAMQTPTMTMGERIKQLRLARGWSQGQLADRVGVTTGAISHWESGLTKNIKLETFLRLCEELGTVPHYLIFGPGKQPHSGRSRQA